jgi:hypothetical protein
MLVFMGQVLTALSANLYSTVRIRARAGVKISVVKVLNAYTHKGSFDRMVLSLQAFFEIMVRLAWEICESKVLSRESEMLIL